MAAEGDVAAQPASAQPPDEPQRLVRVVEEERETQEQRLAPAQAGRQPIHPPSVEAGVENLGGVPPAFESRGQKAQPEVLHPLAPFVAPPPAIRQHHLAHGQTSATSRTPTGEARIPIA